MPQLAAEPWISIAAIAKPLGVQEESVRRWIKGRAMPAAKIGKVWRFKVSEVDARPTAGSRSSKAYR